MSVQMLVGDCRAMMASLPANSVHCVVTSPPYMGLRSYNTDPQTWADGWVGELGGEPTLALYIAHMVEVFEGVKRVLHPMGVAWLNIGDSYANDEKWGGTTGGKHAVSLHGEPIGRAKKMTGLKGKDLMMVPHRVAIALQDAGWWVRSDVVWAKGSCMPESVTDRPTRSHEYVFLLAKSQRYYYDAVAVAEPAVWSRHNNPDWQKQRAATNALKGAGNRNAADGGFTQWSPEQGRNRRTVWQINPEATKDAHFAVMPSKLVEPCILAGTSERGCCPACLAPWERVVERSSQGNAIAAGGAKAIALQQLREQGDIGRLDGGRRAVNGSTFNNNPNKRPPAPSPIGWRPACACDAGDPIPCTVLDPFAGSGTVLKVAVKHRRHAIGCELNEEYAQLIDKRLNGVQQTLPWDAAPTDIHDTGEEVPDGAPVLA